MRMMQQCVYGATLACAWLGYSQTTTIEVPQGSGVFPTIGQVNCLEESGSGRYCAATYECSGGVSGELWGDLANHDGRRPIGANSPVANERDCVITVDGAAAVRWLTGYRPDGRAGELVGLTTSADALRPVQRIQRPAGGEESGRRLLSYLLERANTTLPEVVDADCRHIEQGHRDHAACIDRVLSRTADALLSPDDPFSRCMADVQTSDCAERLGTDCHVLDRGLSLNGAYSYYQWELYQECWPLAQEILSNYGLEFRHDEEARLFRIYFRD